MTGARWFRIALEPALSSWFTLLSMCFCLYHGQTMMAVLLCTCLPPGRKKRKHGLKSPSAVWKLVQKPHSELLSMCPCWISSACLSRSTPILLHSAMFHARLGYMDCLNGSFALWLPEEAEAPFALWGQWEALEGNRKVGEEWGWAIYFLSSSPVAN